jgi:hypothetical protein
MRSTGFVLAAGGIAAANEVIFTPVSSVAAAASNPLTVFNWRLIPATLILALLLGGVETIAPGFAVSLAGLTLLSVLVIPIGNAPTPLDNLSKLVTGK